MISKILCWYCSFTTNTINITLKNKEKRTNVNKENKEKSKQHTIAKNCKKQKNELFKTKVHEVMIDRSGTSINHNSTYKSCESVK